MVEARQNRTPLVGPGAIDHHVADMTATFSADVTLDQAQAKLAEANQWLPIDGDPSLTIGRLIDLNSTGPLRLGYGAWRDLLLGAQFLNGLEELITAGGRTVKNVAGYDLTKFMVGQGGIFGKLVTVTTRTYKRPAGAVVVRFDADARLVNQLMPTDLRPQWMMLNARGMWCGYLGDETTLDWYARKVQEMKPAELGRFTLEEEISLRGEMWKTDGEKTFRVAIPPSRVKEFVEAARPTSWVADAAFGIVIGGCAADSSKSVCETAQRLSGTITLFQNERMEYEPDEGQRALLERLKQSFDPDGKLAPLPWLRNQ